MNSHSKATGRYDAAVVEDLISSELAENHHPRTRKYFLLAQEIGFRDPAIRVDDVAQRALDAVPELVEMIDRELDGYLAACGKQIAIKDDENAALRVENATLREAYAKLKASYDSLHERHASSTMILGQLHKEQRRVKTANDDVAIIMAPLPQEPAAPILPPIPAISRAATK